MCSRRRTLALSLLVGVAFATTACIEGPRNNVHMAQGETTESATAVATPAPSATTTTGITPSPFLGKVAPEIAADDWIGSTKPVLLRDQEDRIVVLLFCKL